MIDREIYVGRVFPIEGQRELGRGFDADKRQRSQLALYSRDEGGDHTCIGQIAEDEIADPVGPNRCEGDYLQAKSSRSDCDIGGTSTHHRIEAGNVLEVGSDLLCEQIHVGPADGDEVVRHPGMSSS